jgi:cytochrome c
MSRPIRIVVTTLAACASLLRLTVGMPATPADEGRVAFNNSCRTCHSLKAGDNRLGPSLHGIIGAKAGQSTGYAYSQSLRQSGVTWNEATLERWIENPEAVIPNNNMKPYSGLADAAVRKKIVDFLKNNNDPS